MISELTQYRSVVFDCDGVLLNSNELKSKAFHAVAGRFGNELADLFLAYHQSHGGISRHVKFHYLVENFLGMTGNDELVSVLLDDYAQRVRAGLLTCEIAPGLKNLRRHTPLATWSVASGGDQAELRDVFETRGLSWLFDGGIHGSPARKIDILRTLLADGSVKRPALFLGDSRYDHECAAANDVEFLFVSGWTEFYDWRAYCTEHGIDSVGTPAGLLGDEAVDAAKGVFASP